MLLPDFVEGAWGHSNKAHVEDGVEVSVNVDGLLPVVEVDQGHKCLIENVETESGERNVQMSSSVWHFSPSKFDCDAISKYDLPRGQIGLI